VLLTPAVIDARIMNEPAARGPHAFPFRILRWLHAPSSRHVRVPVACARGAWGGVRCSACGPPNVRMVSRINACVVREVVNGEAVCRSAPPGGANMREARARALSTRHQPRRVCSGRRSARVSWCSHGSMLVRMITDMP